MLRSKAIPSFYMSMLLQRKSVTTWTTCWHRGVILLLNFALFDTMVLLHVAPKRLISDVLLLVRFKVSAYSQLYIEQSGVNQNCISTPTTTTDNRADIWTFTDNWQRFHLHVECEDTVIDRWKTKLDSWNTYSIWARVVTCYRTSTHPYTHILI